jgi:hypothetical protein
VFVYQAKEKKRAAAKAAKAAKKASKSNGKNNSKLEGPGGMAKIAAAAASSRKTSSGNGDKKQVKAPARGGTAAMAAAAGTAAKAAAAAFRKCDNRKMDETKKAKGSDDGKWGGRRSDRVYRNICSGGSADAFTTLNCKQ